MGAQLNCHLEAILKGTYVIGHYGLQLFFNHQMSRFRKPAFCPGENKGADQLQSKCAADQHLCFR